MFAVVRTGGKQYRVAANDVISVEKLDAEPGAVVELTDVLMVGNESAQAAGTPVLAGATVAAEVVKQTRAEKIIVFKKKRRKDYRRTRGHRQHLTVLRITEILTDGKKPARRAAAKAEARTGANTKAKATAAGKPAAKKPAAKKPAAKKPAAKKPAAKKPAAKKPAAKKPAAKKSKE